MEDAIENYKGRIDGLITIVAGLVAKNPLLAEDVKYLNATLRANLKDYGDPAHCYNCGRSMKVTVYTADLHDALLILAMGREVRKNLEKGIKFTDANKVHLPTLNVTNATNKRSTKCDYLGLIKQPENWRGSGYWLLTHWGWKALGGQPIPRSVRYWEGHLLSRSQETTTLPDMFKVHQDLVELAIQKQKAIKADYRAKFEDYHPWEWTEFGGYIQQENLI